ncbi:cobalamin biosynthesis protein [Methylobacterium sp. J-068]|uniref:cobalamin biosynthesis protein n=1 Tax=Methylobacterium sp. J-068 TaxID=2836649 RepID=UPI001FBAFCB2|nr:cobalamin biosynthesis protein [Methylobacterium sp. J-068]MCJ2036842.1 cobalamin biosynthesis protein [Methylobacterium sp. J-068]
MGLGEAVTAERPAPDIVAGLGFRHAASTEAIRALIHRAFDDARLPLTRLACLATPADRAGEPAIGAVAAHLGRPLVPVSADAMVAVDAQVVTRSGRIAASRGVGSVAEAAALAAAGDGATLLLARIASAEATCALALCR